jgi:hypothetical protein
VLFAIKDAASQGLDGASLIALGFVAADELKVHKSLYWRAE